MIEKTGENCPDLILIPNQYINNVYILITA